MENQPSFKGRKKPYFMFPLFAIGFIFLGGFLVMLLWNAIIPEAIPSINRLNYWQATGLLLLCRILAGGFRKPAGRFYGGPAGGPYWREKMAGMSEEEKQKFREEWKRRCGRN